MRKTQIVNGARCRGVGTLHDIESAVDALGIDVELVDDVNGKGLCPMHETITGKADNNPSWFIHLESGTHHCFSCGYKGTLVGLVCDVLDLYKDVWGERFPDYEAGDKWLKQHEAEIPFALLRQKLEEKAVRYEEAPQVEESHLAIYTEPPAHHLHRRGIDEEAARHYGILWDPRRSNWILPLRDSQHGTLIGWQVKGAMDRYFRNHPTGLKKASTVFGVEKQNTDSVIVVESPLDCARIRTAGWVGAVALCGMQCSEEQAKILRRSKEVIVALDNPRKDDGGKKGADIMLQWAAKYNLNVKYFNYSQTDAKDPGDMTNAEIEWAIENAKSGIRGREAYV